MYEGQTCFSIAAEFAWPIKHYKKYQYEIYFSTPIFNTKSNENNYWLIMWLIYLLMVYFFKNILSHIISFNYWWLTFHFIDWLNILKTKNIKYINHIIIWLNKTIKSK